MHTVSPTVSFADPDLMAWLAQADDCALDHLGFGVVGIDAAGLVCRYNHFESRMAGLSPARVLGRHFFSAVAPCMNNALVAQRLAAATASGSPLDALLPHVLTLRMRPVKVTLRLLASPAQALHYVLVHRPE